MSDEERRTASKLKAWDVYRKLGIKTYKAIDSNGLDNALEFDLNEDIRETYGFNQQYDLVTNFGTSEHCFDQFSVFRNAHNLCKVGGMMIGIVPFQGYIDHGFNNYQPLFFHDLAAANDYDLIGLKWNFVTEGFYPHCVLPYDKEMITAIAKKVKQGWIRYEPGKVAEELAYAFIKKKDQHFLKPFQGKWLAENKLEGYSDGDFSGYSHKYKMRRSFYDQALSSDAILKKYIKIFGAKYAPFWINFPRKWSRFYGYDFNEKLLSVGRLLKRVLRLNFRK